MEFFVNKIRWFGISGDLWIFLSPLLAANFSGSALAQRTGNWGDEGKAMSEAYRPLSKNFSVIGKSSKAYVVVSDSGKIYFLDDGKTTADYSFFDNYFKSVGVTVPENDEDIEGLKRGFEIAGSLSGSERKSAYLNKFPSILNFNPSDLPSMGEYVQGGGKGKAPVPPQSGSAGQNAPPSSHPSKGAGMDWARFDQKYQKYVDFSRYQQIMNDKARCFKDKNGNSIRDPDMENMYDALARVLSDVRCDQIEKFDIVSEGQTHSIQRPCLIKVDIGKSKVDANGIAYGSLDVTMKKGWPAPDVKWDANHLTDMSVDDWLFGKKSHPGFYPQVASVCKTRGNLPQFSLADPPSKNGNTPSDVLPQGPKH